MVISQTVLRDCYKRSNPSQFNNLTVIDYNYFPKWVVIHYPVHGRRANQKSNNTHRLYFTSNTEGYMYFGINYSQISGNSIDTYSPRKYVIMYKTMKPFQLENRINIDRRFILTRPSRYQFEMFDKYRCSWSGYALASYVRTLKKGETIESKYKVGTKFIQYFINNGCSPLIGFQSKFQKGLDFYKDVYTDQLVQLYNEFKNDPLFKQMYQYTYRKHGWGVSWDYLDYLRMYTRLVKANYIKAKDWPKTPTVEKLRSYHDKILPIFHRYCDMQREKGLKKLQASYTRNHYRKAQKYEAHNSDFSVIACKKLIELVDEGRELHHCVGSYTESVGQGKEYILFLRRNSEIDTPFFTIDITSDGAIRQIHGNYNCGITDEIKPFLNDWIKLNNLKFENNKVLCHL